MSVVACSIIKKTGEFQVQIDMWKYVVAKTDTCVKEGYDWVLNIPDYKVYRKDRKGGELVEKVEEIIAVLEKGGVPKGSTICITLIIQLGLLLQVWLIIFQCFRSVF
eukprot:g35237.t1